MAGIVSGARMQSPDDFDYSRSHRAVPLPPTSPTPRSPPTSPTFPAEASRPRTSAGQQAGGHRGHQPRSRRGSLSSILHRSASSTSHSHSNSNTTPADAPPLPTTLFAQVNAEAALARAESTTLGSGSAFASNRKRSNTATAGTSSSPRPTDVEFEMLRKVSRARTAEKERMEQERLAAAAAMPKQPPQLPSLANFHGDDTRPDSFAIFNSNQHYQTSSPAQATANFSRPGHYNMPSSNHTNSSSPAYAIKSGNAFAQQQAASSHSLGKKTNGEYAEPAESMAHRGRYSYASTNAPVPNVSSPRRVRRRKDPTPFNILVVGAKNSGKTSFISFLRHSFALSKEKTPYSIDTAGDSQVNASNSSFTSHYLETDMEGERVGLTLWDSAGLEKHIIDLQLREMAAFVEAKFEETFVEEQKVMRSPGAKDTHIHCVFLVLDPIKLDSNVAASSPGQKNGVSLAGVEGLDDEMDLQVIRALWGKTTVIPVIAKADTLTTPHMAFLKRAVWSSLKTAKLDPLEALELDDDEEEAASEDDDDEANGASESPADSDSQSSSSAYDLHPPKPRAGNSTTHNRTSSLSAAALAYNASSDELPYLPMSILSPDPYSLPPFNPNPTGQIGRPFSWGLADPYNETHCDFTRLRESIFAEWRSDLRDLSRTKWYENWRTSRLRDLPGTGRQRVKGGITPVAAVPREGRTGSAGATAGVPRSASAMTGVSGQGIGMAIGSPTTAGSGMSKAERMMGIGSAETARGGTYRGVETYQ